MLELRGNQDMEETRKHLTSVIEENDHQSRDKKDCRRGAEKGNDQRDITKP